jgi:hypothetical protein
VDLSGTPIIEGLYVKDFANLEAFRPVYSAMFAQLKEAHENRSPFYMDYYESFSTQFQELIRISETLQEQQISPARRLSPRKK